MDDGDGGLSFDFEGGLDSVPAAGGGGPAPSSTDPGAGGGGDGPGLHGRGRGRGSYRQTVCRHWLRGLCMKGEACGFLHQFDKARMPVCRFFRDFGECREPDCAYKHSYDDVKECNMYKMGFCPNGPSCRYKHVKLPGPPPPVEEVLQKILQMRSFNKFGQHRNSNYNQQMDRPQHPQGSGLPNQNSAENAAATAQPAGGQQAQTMNQQPPPPPQQQQQKPNTNDQVHGVSNGHQATRIATSLPEGPSRYFIVKSCNRENLEISVQQGIWATQRSNEAKLNEAFESTENVILIFSINRTRHFQGCAKMTSRIGGYIGGGNWKSAHGTAHYGRNFSIQWLKLCELSFQKTHHLRNPYNDNLPVKISRDCQELEPSIGEQLASLLYLEPDSELTAMLIAAEAKREEEKAKGVSADEAADNQDIVLFDDNEEEEEEESEEEDESNGQESQGRGRGRGMMWPPQIPMMRGVGPMMGGRGFPPNLMGDGFGFGGGFGMPDPFGVPRGFPPFGGPRFPGDFGRGGPMPGMVFPGRPPQPGGLFPMGLDMMMGPGRGPLMGGMGMGGPGRPNRPMGMASFMPPPPPNNRAVKRDQRRPGGDRGDRYETASDQGSRGHDNTGNSGGDGARSQSGDRYGRSALRDDDSESEEEAAPRRSRKR
ncbi:zinc finger CCCH domain-containing protein 45 [Phragmites australis]|uniref:zinc finger CCCH domain-containing protein 45 n=1 Tax=Phragmites australis TaxID=29695 RepID=UPI002D79E7B4|nr:zinc finger CCCH domain-containing protein 45 [Phragmites australis]